MRRSDDATKPPMERSRRSVLLATVAVAISVVGCAVTALAARTAARHDSARARVEFSRSAAQVTSELGLAIQREEDLAVQAAGYFLAVPAARADDFTAWSTSIEAMRRYPELLGWAHVTIVSADELLQFADVAAIELVPVGPRPFYCLVRIGQNRVGQPSVSPGFDYCAGPAGAATLASRDSGVSGYQIVDAGAGATLAVRVPFYRGGGVPATVAERRAAFAGWIGMGFDPGIILADAARGQQVDDVELSFRDGTSNLRFHTGTAAEHAQSVTASVGSGWTVAVSGPAIPSGLFGQPRSAVLFVGRIVASVLLGSFVFMLGAGRSRARHLVELRTDELRHQALHDSLTGLPNRALIMDRIDQLLIRGRRHSTTGAALYVDLDDFKNVNDTLGHAVGDQLLIAVAERLAGTLRDADTIGRMGGDEFVVLIDGATLEVGPELVAERLLDVMRQPFLLPDVDTPLMVDASIGIAIGDRTAAGDLLRDADVALYEAKAAGKNRYEIFEPTMQTDISRRIDLEFDLRNAIELEQFRLVYQPIYDLADLTVVGAEALLRWDHAVLGAIEPDEFVPILEQTGRILDVGAWTLREACRRAATWQANGNRLDISVNVSGRQLDHDGIVTDITEALDRSGLAPRSLIIEVTETALMRNAAASAHRLRAISELGVRIAVDDFGTGYSSLAYLQQFPVDSLKIDRRFTNAIATSRESRALISTLVQLGKDLGLTTVAEGVETSTEMSHLRDQQVDHAQGFFLSCPLDPADLEAEILAPARRRSASFA